MSLTRCPTLESPMAASGPVTSTLALPVSLHGITVELVCVAAGSMHGGCTCRVEERQPRPNQ